MSDEARPTREELVLWRILCRDATPGEWAWFVNTKAQTCYLATLHRGRIFVMQTARWGMQGAVARFQVPPGGAGRMTDAHELGTPDHNGQVTLIHPDAQLIASAPTAIAKLLAEVDALEKQVDTEGAAALRNAAEMLEENQTRMGREIRRMLTELAEMAEERAAEE